MFSTIDTIVAIATPPGRGGIGVVRLSGPEALDLAARLVAPGVTFAPRHATLTSIRPSAAAPDNVPARHKADAAGRAIDQAVVTYFSAPHSYTGDDVIEVSAHGSPVVLHAIVNAAVAAGARLARPGEFTLRAFLNGRIDLTQAEAVADLIDAATPAQAHVAFDQLNGTLTTAIASIDESLFDLIARLEASVDFPEEGYHFVDPGELAASIDGVIERTTALLAGARRGRLLREGLQLAIVGPPNVGKSSLFNALVGAERAIVTPVPGTTRDLVSEAFDLDGLRVTLVDTAGLRTTSDIVEAEGVARSEGAARAADLVLLVEDLSTPPAHEQMDINATRSIRVGNKSDLPGAASRDDVVAVSAKTGAGLDKLRQQILINLDVDLIEDRPAITNARHIALVEEAACALRRARVAALHDSRSLPEEFVLVDLQAAREALEQVTGKRTSDDVLTHIFERFCIGK